jgi:outer membrane biosynthesis protein TonB
VIKSDNPLFTKSAIKALKSSVFSPAKDKKGNNVDAEIRIPIKFEIDF